MGYLWHFRARKGCIHENGGRIARGRFKGGGGKVAFESYHPAFRLLLYLFIYFTLKVT